jgi:hypothetical protein
MAGKRFLKAKYCGEHSAVIINCTMLRTALVERISIMSERN